MPGDEAGETGGGGAFVRFAAVHGSEVLASTMVFHNPFAVAVHCV